MQREEDQIRADATTRNESTNRQATRFSVLIPAYNRQHLIAATIDSVLSQTFSDYEVIVVDDGSTDDTREVLRSYGTRIRVFHQNNQGPEAARSRAAAMAQGDYLVFLDSDDLLQPWALATYDHIIKLKAPALMGAAMTYYWGEPLRPELRRNEDVVVRFYPDYLSKDVTFGVSCSNIVIARLAYERCYGHLTPKTFPMDTFDMLLRFGIVGPCAVVEEPATVLYRMHDSNAIRDVQGIVDGAMAVIGTERQGQYPGAARRRFERYAVIGGMTWGWIRQFMRIRRPGPALKLLLCSLPMIVVGALRRLWFSVYGVTGAVRLSGDQMEASGDITPAELTLR